MSGVNLKMKFKLNETGNKSIHEILDSQFKNVGPFSKETDQSDIMSGLSDLWKAMEKGGELKSSKVQKDHLFSFIKAVAIHQGWAEEFVQQTGDDEIEEANDCDDNQEDEIDDTHEKDQNGKRSESVKKTLNVNIERKDLHSNVCKFYRSAKCIYGMDGKTKDKRGNTCQYDHPTICKKFKMFEKNPEKGCQEKECDKMHVKFCKWYQDCKNKENCKFYHPKRKQTKLMKSNNQHSFQPRDGSRPLQKNKRIYECNNCDTGSEKMNFLGQHYLSQVSSRVWENQSQAYQYKQPFSSQENMQEQNKKEMRGILTNIEKLFNQAKYLVQMV